MPTITVFVLFARTVSLKEVRPSRYWAAKPSLSAEDISLPHIGSGPLNGVSERSGSHDIGQQIHLKCRPMRLLISFCVLGLLAWAQFRIWNGKSPVQLDTKLRERVQRKLVIHKKPTGPSPQYTLGSRCTTFPTSVSELSALILYLVDEGGIVETSNGARGICAEQLVGFSISTDAERQALHDLERELSEHHPLVLIGSRDDPSWHRIQAIMSLHDVEPQLSLVDISHRIDHEIVIESLSRLTGSSTFPQLLCKGRLLGGYDIVEKLVQDHSLVDLLKRNNVIAQTPDQYLLGNVMERWSVK